jgi:hypothetical protein
MLQWLYTYVVSICSQYFICIFERMLQVCLSGCCIYTSHICCKYFILILHMFVIVFKRFSGVFCECFRACFKCFILQVLHLYVLKVDRVLYMGRERGRERSHAQPPGAGDVRAAWAPCERVKRRRAWETKYSKHCSTICHGRGRPTNGMIQSTSTWQDQKIFK